MNITVISLYNGHCGDLELVSLLVRVCNCPNLFQSNISNKFLRGVRYSGVSARRGDPKTLNPCPWTPLRTLHKKDNNKNDNQRFDLPRLFFASRWRNFDCYAAQILLWRWKLDLRTSKKTDNSANLCFSFCICSNRLSPPFCSAHSPSYSLTRPRLHKLVLLRQRKMPICCPLEITMPHTLFDSYVFSSQIFQQGDFVMIDRAGKIPQTVLFASNSW